MIHGPFENRGVVSNIGSSPSAAVRRSTMVTLTFPFSPLPKSSIGNRTWSTITSKLILEAFLFGPGFKHSSRTAIRAADEVDGGLLLTQILLLNMASLFLDKIVFTECMVTTQKQSSHLAPSVVHTIPSSVLHLPHFLSISHSSTLARHCLACRKPQRIK